MKKIVNFSFKVLFLVLVAAISCDTEEMGSAKAPGPELRDGVLRFSSQEELKVTVSNLQKNQSGLDAWEKQFKGYESMRSAYEKLTLEDAEKISTRGTLGYENILTIKDDNGEPEIVRNLEDDIMATLVNKEGLIYIGDDAYKVLYNDLIKVNKGAGQKSLLKDVRSAAEVKGRENVEVYNITHKILYSTKSNGRDETCYREYRQGGKKNRLKGEIWATNLGPVYSSAGARTRHQERILGAWFADKIPQIRLQVTGQVVQTFQEYPPAVVDINYDTGILYNSSGESETFEFCINAGCTFSFNYITSSHWGICDDNSVRSCTVTW